MTDTVFILGAGYSHTAGIPLLSGFVERMWQFAIRQKNGKDPLSQSDLKIFNDAIKIRDELDSYHGRAMFDDRNIEDILSMLSFNLLGGSRRDKEKISAMNRAIARTIELCCSTNHPGISKQGRYSLNDSGSQIYRDFWKNIISVAATGKSVPTIITFNYDLILERSLFQLLIGTNYNRYSNRFPFSRIAIDYSYDLAPKTTLDIDYTQYERWNKGLNASEGMILKLSEPIAKSHTFEIEILKLHGSLNFSKRKERQKDNFAYSITESLVDPFILPPIFNKMTNETPTKMWQTALERLRTAKNIVIVGYSLPQTDIYMQYFLKAALGPNLNLNRIYVFDPILFSKNASSDSMKHRYESCFADQLRQRIDFEPSTKPLSSSTKHGTADHFVKLLEENRGELIF